MKIVYVYFFFYGSNIEFRYRATTPKNRSELILLVYAFCLRATNILRPILQLSLDPWPIYHIPIWPTSLGSFVVIFVVFHPNGLFPIGSGSGTLPVEVGFWNIRARSARRSIPFFLKINKIAYARSYAYCNNAFYIIECIFFLIKEKKF